MIKNLFHNIVWKYGTCSNRFSRRNRFTGKVQFRAVQKGEMTEGLIYPKDFWADFDPIWWSGFK